MSREKPCFRRDLEATSVEADGQSYVDVRDPKSGAHFALYDFEYRVALAFDGLPLATVIPWVKLSTGMELDEGQLQAFADRLAELGFLENDSVGTDDATRSPASVASAATAPDLSDVPSRPEVSPEDDAASLVTPVVAQVEPEVWNSDGRAARFADARSPAALPVAASAEGSKALVPAVVEAFDERPTAKAEPSAVSFASSAWRPSPPDASSSVAPGEWLLAESSSPRSYVTPPPVLVARPHLTPPPAPWATPRPILTPAPATLGPSLVEQPSARRRLRRSVVLFGSLGVLAAVAVVAVLLPFVMAPQEAPRPRVRVQAALPTTVFRFFDGVAAVRALPGTVLKFPAAGKVTQVIAAGKTVSAGDMLAAVEGSRALLDKLAGQRERLAFAQQMAEGMRQAGNTTEEERQNSKVEARNAKLAMTLRELADVAVVATAPATVEEALAHVGETVEAGAPAVRLRSVGFGATFKLGKTQLAQVRRLGFCRLEVDGDMFDCRLREIDDDGRVEVDVSTLPPSLADKPARLARARFEAAVVVPSAAVIESGNHDELFIVSPRSRLESRPVTVAERDAHEAVVVQGVDRDEPIVVEGPSPLRSGMQVVLR